ncbi:MAG: nicotinate phosphoribosyltransferase [Clostridiaceae bacterium]|nr:nicotinate phosphoribosyltransferase [Clostridiaceae bacterium]
MDLKWTNRQNMTMLTDFYEFTMANGYLKSGMREKEAVFDMFFRTVPENGGFAIMAGLEQLVDHLLALEFDDDDIEYLQSLNVFDQDFIDYLHKFEFKCDVWAVNEGLPIFPGEPILKVKGPIMHAQLVETMILLIMNHQSLIATKASRIVRAAGDRVVMEFGARRAQGVDAAVLGARAAYIGGVNGTSCTIAGEYFDIPVMGTMAHSWVQAFPTEYDAFAAYAAAFPDDTHLLVDTYNTLRSGIPNAIRVAKDILEPEGKRLKSVRIDSGDLTYLSINARKMLDEAGLNDCGITVSNSVDEYLIRELLHQGARIDSFGVGERLITSRSDPVFGGVYKLAAVEEDGEMLPKMKFSDNPEKVTNPGDKQVYRLYDRYTGKAEADLITLADEVIDDSQPLTIFDPYHTWKRKTLPCFRAEPLLKPVFVRGKSVYERKTVKEVREYCLSEQEKLWDTVKRFEKPQTYYVDLSEKLWTLKDNYLRRNNPV